MRLKRVLQGSGSNLLRLACTSLAALALPPLLTHLLSSSEYNAWVALLQLSTYVALLDVGLQTVVARFVAEHHSLQRFERASSVVKTASAMLVVGAGIGIVLVLVGASFIPALFPAMPPALHDEVRLAFVIVGASSAIMLPFGPFLSVFVGLQSYGFPTVLTVSSRVVSALLIVTGAELRMGLVPMAVAVAVVNALTVLAQYLGWRISARRKLENHSGAVDRRMMVPLLSTSAIFALWSLGGLLVSGLDTVIVGHYDFAEVGAFGIAATAANFMSSLLFGIFGPLMPAAAAIHGPDAPERSATLLVRATRYSSLAILVLAVPLSILSFPILLAWVGPEYADPGAPLLRLLVLGNAIRQVGYAYSLIVVARGQQRGATIATMSEAVVNVVASVLLANVIGATGVALGTVIGATVSVLLHLTVSMRFSRTAIPVVRRTLVAQGVFRPAVAFTPILLLLPFLDGATALPAPVPLMATAALLTCGAVVVLGLTSEDRRSIGGLIGGRSRRLGRGTA